MNHNNRMTFGQYIWNRERKFAFVLMVAVIVLVLLIIAALAHPGYELTTTLEVLGVLSLAVFGGSAYFLHQNYRDYRNGTRR